jgi:putative transcriptional regulator
VKKKRSSANSPSGSKKTTVKLPTFGEQLIQGMEQFAAHMRGESQQPVRVIKIADVRKIREKSGLSQEEFSACFGFTLRTLQEWEQGRARPDRAVNSYLLVIDRDPEAVRKALAAPVPKAS